MQATLKLVLGMLLKFNSIFRSVAKILQVEKEL